MSSLKDQISSIQNNPLPNDKILLHLNKSLANVNTNKNCLIQYSLKEPERVYRGDTITLYKAFLNVRGQDSMTINIREDITQTLKLCYYIPDDTRTNIMFDKTLSQNVVGAERAKQYNPAPSCNFSCQYDLEGPNSYHSFDYTHPFNTKYHSPQGAPRIMGCIMDYGGSGIAGTAPDVTNDKITTAFFDSNTAKIAIKAGNYSVDAIAEIITEQLNGQRLVEDKTGNIFFNSSVDDNQFKFNSTFERFGLTGLVKVLFQENIITLNPWGKSDLYKQSNDYIGDIDLNDVTKYENRSFFDLSTFNRIKERAETFYNDPTNQNLYTVDNGPGNPKGLNVFELTRPRSITKNFVETESLPQFENYLSFGNEGDSDYSTCMAGSRSEDTTYDTILYPTSILGSTFGIDIFKEIWNNGRVNEGYVINPMVETTNFGNVTDPDTKTGIKQVLGCINMTTIFNLVKGGDGLTSTQCTQKEEFDPIFQSLKVNEDYRTIGTKSFMLSFNSGKVNRFSFSNFHEPQRIPTYSQANDSDLPVSTTQSSGSPSTKIFIEDPNYTENNLWYFAERKIKKENREDIGQGADYNKLKYNIESSSGVQIMSFDYDAVQATDKYKDIVSRKEAIQNDNTKVQEARTYDFLLNFMPHDWWFSTEAEAKTSWSKNLWNQLGFSYNQLGNISGNLEEYHTHHSLQELTITENFDNIKKSKCAGIITHNDASLSLATSLSGLGDEIIPNSNSQSGGFQTFDTVGTLTGSEDTDNNQIKTSYTSTDDKQSSTFIFPPSVQTNFQSINVQANTKFLEAQEFPDLAGGDNYFVIESDIIKRGNARDPKSSKKNIVGFVSKENSVADTLFSTEGLQLNIKQDEILDSFDVRVTNPDGTDVSDSILKNSSGFIFLIERNGQNLGDYEQTSIDLTTNFFKKSLDKNNK